MSAGRAHNIQPVRSAGTAEGTDPSLTGGPHACRNYFPGMDLQPSSRSPRTSGLARLPALRLLLILPFLSFAEARRPPDAIILDYGLYLQVKDQPFDTICLADTVGKQLLRLNGPCALSAALLVDMGYTVLALTQWKWEMARSVWVGKDRAKRDRYARILVSDYLVETVSEVRVTPRTEGLDKGYAVTIHFGNGAFSDYSGAEDLCATPQPIPVRPGDVRQRFSTRFDPMLDVRRHVYAAYVLTDASVDAGKVQKAVEDRMDKMMLDLTYRSPKVTKTRGF